MSYDPAPPPPPAAPTANPGEAAPTAAATAAAVVVPAPSPSLPPLAPSKRGAFLQFTYHGRGLADIAAARGGIRVGTVGSYVAEAIAAGA